MPDQNCKICGSDIAKLVQAREMMYGLGDAFTYGECSKCRCVQLLDPPGDLDKFYPSDYYSFGGAAAVVDRQMVARVKRVRTNIALRLPLTVLDRLVAGERLPSFFGWLGGLGLSTSARIADVGSGEGQILRDMRRQGFQRLVGYDPYLPAETEADGVLLRRGDAHSLQGEFDVIMMHHAFEHVRHPAQVLTALRERLGSRGALIIRIPVADSWAWRHYGADWVGLDPPRHFFLHTESSMRILAAKCGYTIERDFRDGYGLQFWGSEMYKLDEPLQTQDASPRERAARIFSPDQLAEFEDRARRLNATGEGDSAGFVMRPRRSSD